MQDRLKKLPATRSSKALVQVSPLQLYLREIAKYPLLSPEEELELAKLHFEQQDRLAAQRLITANLRLVVKIANDFRRAQSNLLDLIQEGNFGLMQAVKKFNPYKGVKLSSYAAWWIRAYILKYLIDNKSQVKIATTAAQRKLFYNLHKETQKLLQEFETVDVALLAKNLEVTEREVVEMQKRLQSPDLSLEMPVGSDDNLRLEEILTDTQDEAIDDILGDQQVKLIFSQYLEEFKALLEDRDREFFLTRMMSEKPLTLQELGDKFGISRERARQIEARIVQRLKKFVQDKGTLDI